MNPEKQLGNHRGNMRESWGNHRGIIGEIGETLKETKVFCNKTFPGKPVKSNSIRHILHKGEKITQ